MIRQRIVRTLLCLGAVGLALSFFSCSDSDLAGGSETDAKVLGKVVYADSRPAAGARVYLRTLDGGSADSTILDSTTTDSAGRYYFEVNVEDAGDSLLLQIVSERDSLSFNALLGFRVRPKETKDTIAVLRVPGCINGVIDKFTDHPTAVVDVLLDYQGFTLSKVRVDSGGYFTFGARAPGNYTLEIQRRDSGIVAVNVPVTVLPGDTASIRVDGVFGVNVTSDFANDTLVVRAILDSNGIGKPVGSVISRSGDRVSQLLLRNLGLTALPSAVGQLTMLTKLVLDDNRLARLPTEVSRLASLTELSVSRNRLTAFPTAVCSLSTLQILRMDDNSIPTLPADIGKLHNLTELSMMGNRLAALPPQIGGLVSLQILALTNNALTVLPKEFGDLIALTKLTVQNNLLTRLPPEILRCTSLIGLLVGSNRLDSLPADIGGLLQLENLSVERNRLTGFPASIGNLSGLKFLVATKNDLMRIPSEIGKLTGLLELDLDTNSLASLPDSLRFLSSLKGLNVKSNYLCGISSTSALGIWIGGFDSSWTSSQFCDPVRILSPNGGETYRVGDTLRVRWKTSPQSGSSLSYMVWMSVDNSLTWTEISTPIQIGTPGWENYPFVIPATVGGNSSISTRCLVRVKDYASPAYVDISDSIFTIAPALPALELLSPDSGQVYSIGDTISVNWKVNDARIFWVACSLTVDNGVRWFPIDPTTRGINVDNTLSWGHYQWAVPDTLRDSAGTPVPTRSTTCRIKVADYIGCNNTLSTCSYAETRGSFTIR